MDTNFTTKPCIVNQEKKVVFLGCGAVARVALYYLEDFLKVNYQNVYIIDIADVRQAPALQDILKKGANFMRLKVEEDEYEAFFKLLKLKPLDVVVDLLTSSNYLKMTSCCRRLSLVYLNASLELDLPKDENTPLYEHSVLRRHHMLDELNQKLAGTDPLNATHVFEFGMNPGLISHFALKGLLDISHMVLEKKKDPELTKYVKKRDFPNIAKHLGVEVLHCSEIDNQVANIKIDDDMLVNTWSCVGFLDEGLKPPEIGWGTHEKTLPKTGQLIGKNHLAINTPSYKSMHRSYVPDEEFIGMDIPHGEVSTLSRFLSLPDYCPTIQYVYRLCPQTRACLERMPFEQLSHCTRFKVLEPSTCEMSGDDRVGVLFILNKNPITGEKKNWCYWAGTILGQQLSKTVGPTVIQVGVGVLVALKWAVQNPQEGPLYPEALPSEWVIEQARPYLGTTYSGPVAWSPKSTQFVDLQAGPKANHVKEDVEKKNVGVNVNDLRAKHDNGLLKEVDVLQQTVEVEWCQVQI